MLKKIVSLTVISLSLVMCSNNDKQTSSDAKVSAKDGIAVTDSHKLNDGLKVSDKSATLTDAKKIADTK
jgi:uncharacterized protein YcfL